MHALHTLAHRAPPATRTRVRWQPYSSISSSSCSSTSSRSSPASYLNTPASSVSSPQIASLGNELDRIRPGLSTTLIPKEIPARDTPRNKYISGLVDQAVKSLSEIWRPQDIPAVFVASAHSLVMGSGTYEASLILDPKPAPKKPFRNTQLPSPISPTTTTSPPMSSSPVTTTALSPSELDIASTSGSRGNLVPIKSFVHEVLRRSRTSGCVLQTALCYLEAIRCKVPDLVHAEQAGEGVQGEEDRSNWITPATAEELQREAEITAMSVTDKEESAAVSDPNLVATVRVDDISSNDASFTQSPDSKDDECPIVPSHQRLPPGPTLPSLPPLPSPLLCPRRAFLASLILASKFTQDKCYSNRAWAKLSGLPPREIGRCERALGEALDWRLWVGKQPSAAPPSPTPPALVPAPRTLARSQSESCLLPTTQGPFLIREEKLGHSLATDNCGLRRHSTLPADAFAASCSIRAPLGQVPWRTSMPLSSHCHSDIEEDDRMDSSSQATPTEPLLVMGNDSGPATSAYCGNHNKINQSPSPQTPNLSYSPCSTESCSGDRTIQMTSFLDDPTNIFNSGYSGGSDSWPWLDSSDLAPCTSILQQPPPSTWSGNKPTPTLAGPFVGVPTAMDFGGPSPFKMADIDAGPTLCPWASVSERPSAVYPAHW